MWYVCNHLLPCWNLMLGDLSVKKMTRTKMQCSKHSSSMCPQKCWPVSMWPNQPHWLPRKPPGKAAGSSTGAIPTLSNSTWNSLANARVCLQGCVLGSMPAGVCPGAHGSSTAAAIYAAANACPCMYIACPKQGEEFGVMVR